MAGFKVKLFYEVISISVQAGKQENVPFICAWLHQGFKIAIGHECDILSPA